jgi:multidrug resistance efflux pump
VAFAVYTVIRGNRQTPAAEPVMKPAYAPFATYVAGAGLVESASENVAVGTLVPGVVDTVFVKVGDDVRKGAPLFKLDDRDLRAELAVRQSALATAQRQLDKLRNSPRPEEIPVAEAKQKEAEAAVTYARQILDRWQRVEDPTAVNQSELIDRRNQLQIATAKLEEAKASLALLKAGAWDQDKRIAQAEVDAAKARVEATRTDIDRLTVRAPLDGRVLQVKTRPGEFAPAGVMATPLMLLGRTDVLHVRTDVDENEASRVRPGADAVAYVRGNSAVRIPLQFVRIEPYVIPKRSLTGDSTERVDTRVLQVLYAYDPAAVPFPTYVGQQMDVYIDAPPINATAAAAAPK